MMIPLWFFLAFWIGLVTLLSIAALIAASMMMRFGLAGGRTVVITILFIALPTALILTTIQYALGVDWSQTITLFAVNNAPLY